MVKPARAFVNKDTKQIGLGCLQLITISFLGEPKDHPEEHYLFPKGRFKCVLLPFILPCQQVFSSCPDIKQMDFNVQANQKNLKQINSIYLIAIPN
jgi:hypothetical protein